MWCLPSYLADKFLDMIKSGEISPEKMVDMTSEQRRNFFAKEFGETNAQRMNELLESKLILKNQQQGLVTWAKKISGISPESQRGLINRVNKLSDVLTAETEDAFLEDLAAHALGATVTMEEAGNIVSLAQDAAEKKQALEESGKYETKDGKPTKVRMEYGRSVVAFNNYVTILRNTSGMTSLSETVQEYLHNPLALTTDAIKGIAATSRELRTTLDNSFILKQGRNLFFMGITGNFEAGRTWWQTFKKSFELIFNTFSGQPTMDELNAEIWSDADYDIMTKMGVAFQTVEEEMPTEWLNKLPVLGTPFAAAHNAYTGSAHYMRYKLAKMYLDIARKSDVDLNDVEELRSIGKLVNSLTGRGEIGVKSPKPGLINNVFFSPRMLKADFDVLTAHLFDKKMSSFAKKQAATNLMRIIAAQAIILAIAKALKPDSVEEDPRSADFGKIRIGSTRFDISGGPGVLTRLAVRLVPLVAYQNAYIKSTTTGQLRQINTGKYGEATGLDIFEDFLENKLAPAASVLAAHLAGQYKYTDEKPNPIGDIRELFLPLVIDNVFELKNTEDSANIVIGTIADMLGVFTQTYQYKKTKGKRKL